MKAKILLVDDEPDALEVLSYSLKAAGCTTLLAQDGARALAIAKAERPDLIVLDLMLPEVDGLEVCKILRRTPATALTRSSDIRAARACSPPTRSCHIRGRNCCCPS